MGVRPPGCCSSARSLCPAPLAGPGAWRAARVAGGGAGRQGVGRGLEGRKPAVWGAGSPREGPGTPAVSVYGGPLLLMEWQPPAKQPSSTGNGKGIHPPTTRPRRAGLYPDNYIHSFLLRSGKKTYWESGRLSDFWQDKPRMHLISVGEDAYSPGNRSGSGLDLLGFFSFPSWPQAWAFALLAIRYPALHRHRTFLSL